MNTMIKEVTQPEPTPDAIVAQFLEEVLDCPCCITASDEPGIDDILDGRIPQRFSGQ